MSALAQPRLVALLAVAAFLAVTHAAWPDAHERAAAQYHFVLTLGYGHLIGAALPALRRTLARGALACAALLSTAATAFSLYAAAVAAWPPLVLALVALSVWHIAENDLAMGRALGSGTPLPPLAFGGRGQAGALAIAALVLAAAALALSDEGRFGDLFSAATLHHLVGWLAFLIARGASLRRLAAVHAPAALGCLALLAGPEEATAPLRAIAFSPALYLFWSALHVVHSAFVRRARAA
jgi:hypothetical protein